MPPQFVSALVPLIPVLLLIAAAALVLQLLKSRGGRPPCPYESRAELFTPAERAFLRVLEQATSGRSRILGKVRLADLLRVQPGLDQKAHQRAFNRIQSKHVDFVACDPADLRVQFVVELDDRSHDRPERRARDAFVDRAFAAAGIPIFHFSAKGRYAADEICGVLYRTGRPVAERPLD
ncbi:MAG: DUF2726 domain-containing protein [Candidatus Hydrogenedentes bacterium]|nr:DUF2726 domain-containing protein [Candidatus Hydrogenedentota bacterium]